MILEKECDMKVIMSKEGIPISDYKVDDFVNSMKIGETYKISNSIIISGLRVRIKKGDFNPKDIEIFVEDNDVLMKKNINSSGKTNDFYSIEQLLGNYLLKLL